MIIEVTPTCSDAQYLRKHLREQSKRVWFLLAYASRGFGHSVNSMQADESFGLPFDEMEARLPRGWLSESDAYGLVA